jgi:hypothetical protein
MALDCFPPDIHEQVRFVAEPEGALLSLQRQGLLGTSAEAGATLVVDVGGSTTDLVAGWANPATGALERVQRYGGPHGGGLYDAELAKYIADTLRIPASALADDPTAMVALRVSARQLKEALSRMLLHPGDSSFTPQRTVTLVMRNGEIFRRAVKLDEASFLEIARHLIVNFEYLVENGLKAMGLTEDEIGQVVLVGGGSQTFTIARHLRARFGEGKVVLADNPAEAVVRGVALEYGHAMAPPAHAPPEKPLLAKAPWQLTGQEGAAFPLQTPATTIGRKRTNDIWLKDDLTSRFHAELHHTDDGWTIVDLGSSNGTHVNGVRIEHETPHPLESGDEIKIGGMTLTLERN